MAELNHLTAARITYAIGENSYAIDRATLQSWLVQGRMEPHDFAGRSGSFCAPYGV